MRINVHNRIAGSTFKSTWVNSGGVPSQISSALLNRSFVVVSSLTAVSSGNGFFFGLHQLPNTPGPYINEYRAWVNSYEYVNRQLVMIVDLRAGP